MLHAAVLLLELVALSLCHAEFVPPTMTVNLDEDPDVRWEPLIKVFDIEFLKKAGTQVIESTVPKWVHSAVAPIVWTLDQMDWFPQRYSEEIHGMASHFGLSLSDIIILNFAYEIAAHCTSIITQDKNGHVYHGRNLDFPLSVVRNLTVNVIFQKNGKEVYRGTSFAGYVGLWTGQSPKKFTVSADKRGSGHWWNWLKNMMSLFICQRTPDSWLVRETLEEAENYEDAVRRLCNTSIVTGVYYIVGGVTAGEGVVITRNETGSVDIWKLDQEDEGWYRVETNYDHWLPRPEDDYRVIRANQALHTLGQDHINLDNLYLILSLYPICHETTVYTTVMSAAAPEKYKTVFRPNGCTER